MSAIVCKQTHDHKKVLNNSVSEGNCIFNLELLFFEKSYLQGKMCTVDGSARSQKKTTAGILMATVLFRGTVFYSKEREDVS